MGPQKIYTVVGNICETDTLGADRKLNEVREGDILAIKNAGAYGLCLFHWFPWGFPGRRPRAGD